MSEMQLTSILIEVGVLALDASVVYILNRYINRLNTNAEQVKNAKVLKIGPELIDELHNAAGTSIAYACLEGEVNPVGRMLRSNYGDGVEGVIKQVTLVEHKSKRVQGFWSDVRNVLRDTLDQVPFYLQAAEGGVVNVLEPADAVYLMDNLTTTHDKFDPNQTGILQRGIDRIFGEVSKGIHETEKMLLNGTLMLGIGELVFADKKIILQKPSNGNLFVLTNMSKGEVIKRLESNSFFVKIFMFLCGIFGTFIAIHLFSKLYKIFKENLDDRRNQAAIQELRAYRDSGAEDDPTDDSCVVCLTNRREIVLLDCGHICLCGDCVQVLPLPRRCPICRQTVVRYIPTYRP